MALRMLRPTANATDRAIRMWLQRNWDHKYWGLMDCDRCPNRRGPNGSPCEECAAWPHFIEDYRTRERIRAASEKHDIPPEEEAVRRFQHGVRDAFRVAATTIVADLKRQVAASAKSDDPFHQGFDYAVRHLIDTTGAQAAPPSAPVAKKAITQQARSLGELDAMIRSLGEQGYRIISVFERPEEHWNIVAQEF